MSELDDLVQRSVALDRAAWTELQRRIVPEIEAIARFHSDMRSRGLAGLPDDVAEVATATLERLSSDGFRNLQRYLLQRQQASERKPQSFDSWLYGAVDFAIREHLRKRFGRAPKISSDEASRSQPSKRDLGSHAGRLDEDVDRRFLQTLGMTARLTASELFGHIQAEFSDEDARAMHLYYREDKSFDELASALGLAGSKDAERLIRRLNARLRYKFVDSAS